MTKEEKYIARIQFKTKILQASQQSFEDLFTQIKQSEDANFKQVKPQGALGDAKCDGFNDATGQYYQVYAPEELIGKEETALSKMEKSLVGILAFWKSKFEVKAFFFVIKDNYRHVYPSLYAQAKTLSVKHGLICEIQTCKDIEDVFMSLNDDQIVDIVGFIPNPANIETIDYSIMNEVVGYILEKPAPKRQEMIPIDPDFERKILFNNLSKATSVFINMGQCQSFVIRDYFEWNSKFIKNDLRDVFNNLYTLARFDIPDSETKNDEVFHYIVEKASPKNNFQHYCAVYVLMAYYFEYCDIFETPIDLKLSL